MSTLLRWKTLPPLRSTSKTFQQRSSSSILTTHWTRCSPPPATNLIPGRNGVCVRPLNPSGDSILHLSKNGARPCHPHQRLLHLPGDTYDVRSATWGVSPHNRKEKIFDREFHCVSGIKFQRETNFLMYYITVTTRSVFSVTCASTELCLALTMTLPLPTHHA